MDVQAVRTEIVALLNTITGLRAYDFAAGAVPAPAALVGFPDRLEYAGTYGRGQTNCPDLPVLVLVGKSSDRSAAKALGAFVSEAGAKSIPTKILSRTGSWVACDDVAVGNVTFPDVAVAGVDYLAAEFHLQIIGKGV